MAYVKNYYPGKICMDLPSANYIYELPLLSFGDIHGTMGLSLIFNHRMMAEGNLYSIAAGYKLNMQKQLIMSNGYPTAYQNETGNCTVLNGSDTPYTFDDDSHRILRRTGSTYTLENADFSKEIFDQAGRITAAYDKYGLETMEFAYDGNGRLTSIVYRESKVITFSYNSGNCLAKISYSGGDYETELFYAENAITVKHYSGVTYTLAYASPMDFTATASAIENSTTVSYVTKLVKSESNAVVISNLIGDYVADTTKYVFPKAITSSDEQFSQVEVTDHYGVKNRIHFKDNKALYSYEIGTTDAAFVSEKFAGNVQIHSVWNNASGIYASGVQNMNDGNVMSKIETSSTLYWESTDSLPTTDGAHGLYTLSGWIKLPDDQYNSNDDNIPLEVAKDINSHFLLFKLPKPPVGQWAFFAVGLPYIYDNMCAYFQKSLGNIDTRDFRYTFYETPEASDDGRSSIAYSEDVLILHNENGNQYFPLRDASFNVDNLITLENGKVTFEDVLKYKINQGKGRHTNEMYYNRVKNVITMGTVSVSFMYEGNEYALSDCYLGRKNYTPKGLTYTIVVDDCETALLKYETRRPNGNIVSSYTLNENLDITHSLSDGIASSYVRENGLVTLEQVENLYTRATSYGEDAEGNPTLTVTDEFNKSTVYTLDPVWGVVTSVTLPDGTVVTDEYDDDMCSRIKRTFGSVNGRVNSFAYSGGNVSGLQTGSMEYDFTYADGKLSAISKFGVGVEEHEHTNTKTDSYYPTKAGKTYQYTTNYDKYGRVTSIGDTLTNTYNIAPEFTSSGALVGKPDNASSLLAMSMDRVTTQFSKYEYNADRTLKKRMVTGTSFSDKVSTDNFSYDTIKRLKAHTHIYNVTNNKSVGSAISYTKDVSDPSADNTVSNYTYKVNGTQCSYSANSYDAFRRLSSKTVQLKQNTFTKALTYDKTRVSRLTDTVLSKNIGSYNYSYDSVGRIMSIIHATEYTTSELSNFAYDQYGQLVRENNEGLDKTFVYVYNDIGNIVGVKEYGFTLSDTPTGSYTEKTYTYGSTYPDRLTSFNGNSISYDSLGRPVWYKNKNYVWTKDKLSRIFRGAAAQSGAIYDNCTFTYNGYGLRTAKSYAYDPNPGVSSDGAYSYNTSYCYDYQGRLVREYCTETRETGSNVTREFIYLYDESGMIGVMYSLNGAAAQPYYYHRNLHGDVVAIYDASGYRTVEYAYDAWGNCTIVYGATTDLAKSNPIRYRGYYYDRETGLYYLNSRYYSPEWRRFISPDDTAYLDPESVNGLNLYCYCNNDPITLKKCSTPLAGNATVFTTFASAAMPVANLHPSVNNNPDIPGWIQTAVGAYSDVKLGMKYLLSTGMHAQFAYATKTRFMFPEMGGTWSWFKRGSSRLANFGVITSGSFKQILAENARAGFRAIARSVGEMAGVNLALNFAFNFYENDFQFSWDMLWDTVIDTVIGTASTVLAAGAMSLITAGVVAAGLSMPGILVIGGVILLSIGIEWVIREIFDYPD